ncbi:S46 family peptidase [Kozakia baliensis]|uniref:S46 family peptidase n=1 Tax=Kozakia baliensis TaxID=153496 RepID=UPI00087D3111|nr:S46 family peptidase [Kozakia baliensis]AOX20211.1 peptidase S46 [Kozakia baliensis]
MPIKSFLPALLLAATSLSFACPGTALADEGMWTFDHLPTAQLEKAYHFKPSAEWISHVVQSSARLAAGCSASFVSGDGLVMTNHHCANACLSALSDKSHDYFSNGFFSSGVAQEPQCPGMELDRLDGITDVTAQVAQATQGKHDAAYTQAMQEVESRLTKECVHDDGAHWRCDFVTLYHGGQTALYRYRRYQDVRMVMAPEQNIAFFGGDPDNFNYPRYDIDLSMLRVFDNGKPVHTPFLQFDAKGPQAGDLVFTSGNPGRTQRSLPASALAFQRDISNPAIIAMLNSQEAALWQYSRESNAHRQEAENTLFHVQNSLKAYSGIEEALLTSGIVPKREQEDRALQGWIDADPARRKEYGQPYAKVDAAIAVQKQVFKNNLALTMLFHGIGENALVLVEGATQRAKPDAQRRAGFHEAELSEIEAELGARTPFHPELETMTLALGLTKMRQILGEDDPQVKLALGNATPDERAAELVKGTKLGDPAARLALWKGGQKAIAASTDPLIVLVRALHPSYEAMHKKLEDQVQNPMRQGQGDIARAQFARAKAENKLDALYPDATFSPRLSFGTVKGWNQDGKAIAPFTDFAGMYRHATGSDPFKLPQSWTEAKPRLTLSTHLDFVSTNDIVGGNSGSPVIDRAGHAVGLIFDGNLPSLAGDLYYDIETNRAVATDTSAIMAALRDVYHEDKLADELLHGHL